MKNLSFSTLFGILFSIVGIMVGLWISITSGNNDYKYLYVYSGISGFLTGKLLANPLVENGKKFNHKNLILVGILSGLLSHWLCWYLLMLEYNFRFWILNEDFYSRPIDPILAIPGVFVLCFWSWLFVGWVTVLGGITAIYGAKWINKKKLNTPIHNDNFIH
ncbi:MAG: hypothetical protein N4A41_00350 [Crocinitomicaceae bacterium]|nr:hypothetical protein [Crocinitomicaceae bacterium]